MTDHKTILSVRISKANKRALKELLQVMAIVSIIGFLAGAVFALHNLFGG